VYLILISVVIADWLEVKGAVGEVSVWIGEILIDISANMMQCAFFEPGQE
jgi:hypothetical protein